jgi:hypothetical protein
MTVAVLLVNIHNPFPKKKKLFPIPKQIDLAMFLALAVYMHQITCIL